MRSMWRIAAKDLLLEWRSRSRAVAMVFFAVVTLLLFSFGVGPGIRVLRRHAAAYLWLALLFSSTLSLGESFRQEQDDGCLEGLLLLPVRPGAIYYGKAVANTAFLWALGVVLVPFGVALFGLQLDDPLRLGVFIALGAAGIAAPGTLYASMTARVGSRDVLLPLLLFPLIVPALVAAVKGTALTLTGDPMQQSNSWLALLGIFDLIYWTLGGLMFGRVVEDG